MNMGQIAVSDFDCPGVHESNPLVSVLLCTHNSRPMVPIAIKSYLTQDWPNLELVVVDDGEEPIDDLVLDIPNGRYILHGARNLAEKRNVGVNAARGEYIVHFDSDDWSGPHRVTDQIEALKAQDAKVVGYSQAFWYDTREKIAAYPKCGLWGASLAYERQWAIDHPWKEDCDSVEDGWFLRDAYRGCKVAQIDGGENFVALAHGGNLPRPFGQGTWGRIPVASLPDGFRQFMGA